MPTIFKHPKKQQTQKRKYKTISKRDNLNHSSVYNTTTWRALRVEFLKQHPVCQICEAKGRLSTATDVHHIIPISKGDTKMDKQALGFDWNNLQTVCKQCHKDQHVKTIML